MATECEVGDLLEVRIWTSAAEQAAVNVFHYGVNAVAGFAGFADLDVAQDIDDGVGPLYQAILTPNNMYHGVQCQIIHRQAPAPLSIAAYANAKAGAGTVTGSTLPRQCAYVMGWVTKQAGRKYRGRTYFPFPPVTFDSGEGAPTVPAIQAYDAIKNFMLTYTKPNNVEGNEVELTLYHRGKPNGVPPIPWTDTKIIAGLSRAKWGTQRRRGSYGRANASPLP